MATPDVSYSFRPFIDGHHFDVEIEMEIEEAHLWRHDYERKFYFEAQVEGPVNITTDRYYFHTEKTGILRAIFNRTCPTFNKIESELGNFRTRIKNEIRDGIEEQMRRDYLQQLQNQDDTDYEELVLSKTVEEVKDYVESNDVDREAVLQAEVLNEDRSTLVEWLRGGLE